MNDKFEGLFRGLDKIKEHLVSMGINISQKTRTYNVLVFSLG